jgi:hypothetical protein
MGEGKSIVIEPTTANIPSTIHNHANVDYPFMLEHALISHVTRALTEILPEVEIQGGAPEPFYQAPKDSSPAILFFRDDHIRSLFHELAHFCLAGEARRLLDDFGYWYEPCGRTTDQQIQFESVEARPQGLEKLFCEIWDIPFAPSLDDFSGRPPSQQFLEKLQNGYIEMKENPPSTAKRIIEGMHHFTDTDLATRHLLNRV